jgi:hypothetical protein
MRVLPDMTGKELPERSRTDLSVMEYPPFGGGH